MLGMVWLTMLGYAEEVVGKVVVAVGYGDAAVVEAALKKTGKGLPMMGAPSRSTWTM